MKKIFLFLVLVAMATDQDNICYVTLTWESNPEPLVSRHGTKLSVMKKCVLCFFFAYHVYMYAQTHTYIEEEIVNND